jgi:arginase
MSVFTSTQWLGAGPKGRRIELGSALLGQAFGLPAAHNLTTPTEPADFTVDHHIIGRAQLLDSMRAALAKFDEHGDDRLLLIGGDCSVDIAPMAWLARRHPDLRVIYLDAHADLNIPDVSPSGALHGMVLGHLLGKGDRGILDLLPSTLDATQIEYRGVRECDPYETEQIAARSIRVEPIDADLPQGQLHIHLDLDVLDPTEFDHTTYPTPGGPSIAQVAHLLEAAASSGRLVGLTITECAAETSEQLNAIQPLIEIAKLWLTTQR